MKGGSQKLGERYIQYSDDRTQGDSYLLKNMCEGSQRHAVKQAKSHQFHRTTVIGGAGSRIHYCFVADHFGFLW